MSRAYISVAASRWEMRQQDIQTASIQTDILVHDSEGPILGNVFKAMAKQNISIYYTHQQYIHAKSTIRLTPDDDDKFSTLQFYGNKYLRFGGKVEKTNFSIILN